MAIGPSGNCRPSATTSTSMEDLPWLAVCSTCYKKETSVKPLETVSVAEVVMGEWPAVSIEETYRILTAPGAPFEMEERLVRGRRVRVYKNARNSLREIFDIGRSWGPREFIVYEGERQTYEAHFKAAGALGRILAERYGVRKGDRIVVAMRNLPEWSLAFWAGQS